jgi:hypothetical protein
MEKTLSLAVTAAVPAVVAALLAASTILDFVSAVPVDVDVLVSLFSSTTAAGLVSAVSAMVEQ